MIANAHKRVAQWVDVSGSQPARLATESCGEGIPFVWGHALLGSMAQDLDGGVLAWRELTDVARVIRYDARGHGRSDTAGVPEDFRWDKLADNMWQVVERYTSEAVILGGASMGCATALHAACQRPAQVKGLVLVTPPTAWEARTRMQRNYRRSARIVELSRALPFRLLRWVPSAPDGAGFQRRMFSVMAKHLANVNPAGVVGAMRGAALSDLPPPEKLTQLDMPALILAWPDDAIHPLAVAETLADIMPNAQLDVVRGTNTPERWPERLRSFISSLDSDNSSQGEKSHG